MAKTLKAYTDLDVCFTVKNRKKKREYNSRRLVAPLNHAKLLRAVTRTFPLTEAIKVSFVFMCVWVQSARVGVHSMEEPIKWFTPLTHWNCGVLWPVNCSISSSHLKCPANYGCCCWCYWSVFMQRHSFNRHSAFVQQLNERLLRCTNQTVAVRAKQFRSREIAASSAAAATAKLKEANKKGAISEHKKEYSLR